MTAAAASSPATSSAIAGRCNQLLLAGYARLDAHLTDASGAITDTYSYDAFGDLFAQTGETATSYLFAGQQSDTLTGLYSMRARTYDPQGALPQPRHVGNQLQ